MELATYLKQLRERIQEQLIRDTQFTGDCPPQLGESIRYSLLSSGKLIRPCLALMACECCGGEMSRALPVASALEMVHTYSLIHDDLPAMDDDNLRRGRPTNHVQFGEPTAILAGDGLLTLAFQVLAEQLQPPEVTVGCIADLACAAGVSGMVGGQQADLEAETAEQTSLEQLEAIHRRKTGRLLKASLTMGGRVALASPQSLHNLRIYGESVGLAFQIADDLLDVVGDVGKMGKEVRKDADHGKFTYPSLLGIDASRRRAHELIDQACDAVSFFGAKGDRLAALARYIIERDH